MSGRRPHQLNPVAWLKFLKLLYNMPVSQSNILTKYINCLFGQALKEFAKILKSKFSFNWYFLLTNDEDYHYK